MMLIHSEKQANIMFTLIMFSLGNTVLQPLLQTAEEEPSVKVGRAVGRGNGS